MANQNTTEEFEDVRCKSCHRLLFRQRVEGKAVIEIKCTNHRCKRMCKITLLIPTNSNNINLKAA